MGLVVSDMEKALYFYRDLLGLKIQGTTNEEGNFINQLLNKEDIKLKTVKLSTDDNTTRIELFNTGFTHVAFTVDNLDEIYMHLKNGGVQFNCPPKLSPNGMLKVTFCRDFEGNYLELTQEI